MPAAFTTCLGHVPPIPPRTVAFVANLQSIFFDAVDETELLAETVDGIESYGGRLVPILQLLYPGATNLLVLERSPSMELIRWYHDELELKTPQIVVLSHSDYCSNSAPETLAVQLEIDNHEATWVDGYVTDERLMALASKTAKSSRSTPHASRTGNNKLLLHRHLVEQGLPHFETVEVASPDELPAALARLHAAGYARACLKAAVGASGIGMMTLPTDQPPPAVPDFFFADWPCLVQGWEDAERPQVAAIESPSVQLWLDDKEIFAFDLTNQILSAASVHEGNAAPPEWQQDKPKLVEALLSQAEIAAQWLHGLGYRGAGSIDFHLAWQHDQDLPLVRICEINARVTGATYPAMLARHILPGGAWRMQNLHFPEALTCSELLAALGNSGDAYRRGSASGLIPVNVNLNADDRIQKCQMLALGPSLDSCGHHMNRLATILPVDFIHDRD